MEQADRSKLLSDADVVDAVRRGDAQAYALLVARHERSVLALALSILRDLHAAQDLVQDVFVHCYVKLLGLRDGSRFGYWLKKVARRRALRAARHGRRAETLRISTARSLDPEPQALFDDERLRLIECVHRLPKHESLIVALRFFDGHDVKTIAQMTGRPVGTVTKQLSRAIERLRGLLLHGNETCLTKKPSVF